jgi:hypothetical protein
MGGMIQARAPPRPIGSEIMNFESEKSFKNNGSEPLENPQKKFIPNTPTPRRTMVERDALVGPFIEGIPCIWEDRIRMYSRPGDYKKSQ